VSGSQLGRGTYEFTGTHAGTCPNDTMSGTARLIRSDGAVLSGTVTGTETCWERVAFGRASPVHLTFALTTGTRDLLSAHLVFTGTRTMYFVYRNQAYHDSYQIQGDVTVSARVGYVTTALDGHVFAFGGVPSLGAAPTASVTRIALTRSHNGYWIVNAAGQVYAFGDARWDGNAPSLLPGETVRSIAPTTSDRGYWLFSSAGRVLPFGDAHFSGDMHTAHLGAPIVDAAITPDGHGYYLLGADGSVFTFGSAHFYGSTGNLRLNQPADGIAPTATGRGYWLVASDGGVFAFGDARFRGSMGGHALNQPVIDIARYGTGYLMAASDGGIFNFSNQPFFGSATTTPGSPTVAVAVTG
jgi:hypothetical protein